MEDRSFLLYATCRNGIDVNRYDKYMYIFQLLGFDLSFRFRLGVNGVKSKNCSSYLEEQISNGYVSVSNGVLRTTDYGDRGLSNGVVDYNEYHIMEETLGILGNLSYNDLNLLVIIDLVISNNKDKNGLNYLVSNRDLIEGTVQNIWHTSSTDKFNEMVGIISKLERLNKS